MRNLILILFLFYVANSWGQDSNRANRDRAISHVQKAVLKLPTVRKFRKQVEQYVYNKLPLDKETMALIGSTVVTAHRGEVNTKVIKKMNVKILGGNMRPDMMYNFKQGVVSGFATIHWSY